MMYRYTAYTADRKIIRGTIESPSLETAEESLYKAGFKRILKLRKASVKLNTQNLFNGSPRVNQEALLDFTTELEVLIGSGLTLLAALRQLEKQSSNAALRIVVSKLASDLQGGMPFHQALSMHPQVFSETYCSVMEASEKAGSLDSGFRQMSRQMKQQIATKSQIQKAVTQPAIVIALAIVVVIVMVVVVLPPLMDIYRQFGTQLPLTTRILIGFSDFVNNNILIILILLALMVVSTVIFFKRPGTKPLIDRWMLWTPIIGQIIRWNITARFSRTLSNLLGAGILLPDSLSIILRSIGNTYYRESLSEVRKQLVQGQSLSATLGKNKLFPPLLIEMIGVGESSGNLEYVLGTVADYFESKVEKRISKLTSLMEPILILGVGIVVGFIAISMISTIYGLVGSFN